jgi:hypothetical protein
MFNVHALASGRLKTGMPQGQQTADRLAEALAATNTRIDRLGSDLH